MSFNKCSIGGVCYGDVIDTTSGEIVEPNEVSTLYYSCTKYSFFLHRTVSFFVFLFKELEAYRLFIV